MLITTCGAGFRGAIGHLVSIQLHHTRGARFHVSGLHWNHARHILARIHAALEVSGLPRPSGALTLHIGPAHVKPESNELDLPIALCLLAVAGAIDSNKLATLFSMGELALDGRLLADESNPSRANFTCSSTMVEAGLEINRCLVPMGAETWANRFFPSQLPTFHAEHLSEAVDFLQNNIPLPRVPEVTDTCTFTDHWPTPQYDSIADSTGNKEALVLAAAGGHHAFILGPPGSGKTLMARSLAELLPNLTITDRAHLKHMHAMRNEVFHADDRIPFREPHAQSTPASITGAWNALGAMPGELALSHRGVFCMDEFPEFARNAIEALRGPLENGYIDLNRAQGSHRFPAKTLTVATANPCPCGHLTSRNNRCRCTPGTVRKYLSRMTGPLMDRFSIHIETQLDRGPAELSDISALSGKEAIRAISWVRAKKEMLTAPSSLGLDWEPGVKHQLHAWSQQRGVSRRGFESIQHVAETACLIEAWQHQKATESLKISENHMVLATRFRIFDQTEWLDRAFNPQWPQYHTTE
ncbi:MAG: ATP-binding protein [Flavobacteriales bacterium]|nr:ATP-binding protein [Flavobacteriales bacterium]